MYDGTAAQSRHSASGGCSPRPAPVKFKALHSDAFTASATTGLSRPRQTPVKATESVETPITTTSTFASLRCSTTSGTFDNNVDQGQGQKRYIAPCNGTVVVSTDGNNLQDVNNNYDCKSGNTRGRSTWPRKAAGCKLSQDSLSGDSGRRSSRLKLPVWRKRPSLSAVQQVWAEQPTQRKTTTTGDSGVERHDNSSPPSAASSYDPLDTANDNDDRYVTAFMSDLAFTIVPTWWAKTIT